MGAFCTATHYCNTRQHTATHCNTLRSCTAGPPNKVGSILYDEGVNTLQHTATHYTHVNDSPPSTEAIQGKKKEIRCAGKYCRSALEGAATHCNTLQLLERQGSSAEGALYFRNSVVCCSVLPQQCRVYGKPLKKGSMCTRMSFFAATHCKTLRSCTKSPPNKVVVNFCCNALLHTGTHSGEGVV
mmetsp:Transcript_94585/g.138101  ORF Transcript_94585/g.138101 Transcript_94585/m.138101 type:complete len:185 (+) Transcript_94585:1090-1644(+)